MVIRTAQWLEAAAGLMYVVSDQVQFCDDFAHWKNGVLRLLEISDDKGRALIESAVATCVEQFGALPSETAAENKYTALKQAVRQAFGAAARAEPLLPMLKTFATVPNSLCPALDTLDPAVQTLGSSLEVPGQSLKTAGPPVESLGHSLTGNVADTIFAGSISGNRDRMVIGCRADQYGWLVDTAEGKPVSARSISYEEDYFESPTRQHYGIRNYLTDSDWRLEKARRLIKLVCDKMQQAPGVKSAIESINALDVGSATGYFRKAMEDCGIQHFGIDLSRHAINLCRQTFGFDTWQGSVFDLPDFAQSKKFDLITLWDTIEHFDDAIPVVRLLADHMNNGGVLVVRTPNLMAIEADILGDMYYSYKLEHILYFSPYSLGLLMDLCGLKPLYVDTSSHIFKGFLGADFIYKIGMALHGADIVGMYVKQ